MPVVQIFRLLHSVLALSAPRDQSLWHWGVFLTAFLPYLILVWFIPWLPHISWATSFHLTLFQCAFFYWFFRGHFFANLFLVIKFESGFFAHCFLGFCLFLPLPADWTVIVGQPCPLLSFLCLCNKEILYCMLAYFQLLIGKKAVTW